MDYLDWLQWPAMLVTIAAAWLIGSQRKSRRKVGFWVFIASNLLWIAWGWYAHAWALIVLQLCLAAMNIRGARKTEQTSADNRPQTP
ncbi:hypothetical protein JQX08_05045 [Pseudomonas sp. UL073]|uniref:Amino acid transporter n=1 Tax=Zestomonas insulae TaxID=2809017 RepID=A0ABS2IAA4_9GAMM|nr:hypothetical protein [Pseudomonas insulae]MBM7060066.1 hypothetical protein [Pseudomonas insulae]